MPLANSRAFDTDHMMAMVEEIMGTIAAEGDAVIVGRGSPFFLREREDTFRVFTYAPRDEKIRRLLALGKTGEDAEDLVENVDKERMAFIKHYFNADWPTRSLYHLMINTVVGDENVIATILHGMQMRDGYPAETVLRGVR
jgi:cytidylate kinase